MFFKIGLKPIHFFHALPAENHLPSINTASRRIIMFVARNAEKTNGRKLKLVQIVATPNALRALEDANQVPEEYLSRHAAGDWGEVGAEDWKENELSVREGFRVLSSYTLSTGKKLWIITEADRSATTVLLPEDY